MPEPEATRPKPSGDHQETVETSILDRLTGPEQQRPLSVDELIRDFDSQITVEDAVRQLYADGLIHRCGELVFPTRAAVRAAQIRW